MREILSFITSLPGFLMDGGLISARWSHQCRVFLWCAWRARPKLWLVSCCRASPLLQEGGREGKKHKGGGEEKRKRVHDIISPGLLRSSPVEGWERWPTFPSELPSPVSSPPGSLELRVTERRLKDTTGNTIWIICFKTHTENTETEGAEKRRTAAWRNETIISHARETPPRVLTCAYHAVKAALHHPPRRFNMCAGASGGRERSEGDASGWLQSYSSLYSQMLSKGQKEAGAQRSTARQIQTLERETKKKTHTERGIKTSFATASTLSGFIAVGSSKTPHGLVCEPWPESDPHTHTQMHTHNERVTWRGKQEKQGDEADCVGELSVCEWDWSRGKHRCVVDSADKRRMKGCCVGESGLRSAARSAPTNSTFFSESVSPSTCPINNAAPAEIHNEAFLSERDEIILFSWTGSDGILLQIKPPEADEWPST